MTNETGITMPKGYGYSVGPSTPPPPTICITANDYRPLLTIHPDGTVTGEIEDASEAARVFVESLRGYLPKPIQSDVLREALETARDYVADVAVGNIHFNDNIKAMAAEDLTRIDAALQEQNNG